MRSNENRPATIADVVITAADRLARLTSNAYTVDILAGYGDGIGGPKVVVQVGHWLPDDATRLVVIDEVTRRVDPYAKWTTRVQTYDPPQHEDHGVIHREIVIDGIAWDVWAAMTLAETLAAERAA